MTITPSVLPQLIDTVVGAIASHADEIAELDRAIGDGDHVTNLQRGLQALLADKAEFGGMDWANAWRKIGMTLMSTVGGASGSLYATLFVGMGKNAAGKNLDLQTFADVFTLAVTAVKLRGKADSGEKTMLDVLIPVAETLNRDAAASASVDAVLEHICTAAEAGVEATRDMLATKGRASFLGERSRGHIDPGAKSAQVMLAAIAVELRKSGEPERQSLSYGPA